MPTQQSTGKRPAGVQLSSGPTEHLDSRRQLLVLPVSASLPSRSPVIACCLLPATLTRQLALLVLLISALQLAPLCPFPKMPQALRLYGQDHSRQLTCAVSALKHLHCNNSVYTHTEHVQESCTVQLYHSMPAFATMHLFTTT